MASERLNVAVFGGGPAGMSSAIELSERGHNVNIITPEREYFSHSLYTTDRLLPPKLVDRFFSPDYIRKVPYIRALTPNGTDFRIEAGSGRYFMVDYPKSMTQIQKYAEKNTNATFTRVKPSILKAVGVMEDKDGVTVDLDGQKEKYDAVVDATGYRGAIEKIVDPNRNDEFLVEYVYGATLRGDLEFDEMILVLGPGGGTSWVNNSLDNEGCIDVVFSAYGPRSQYVKFLNSAKARLEILTDFIHDKPGIHIESRKPENTYSGLIRSQPTNTPTTKHVYSVGEAAGMAKPSTGDSYQRAIMGGKLLADALSEGVSPKNFHRKWRKKWKADDFYLAAGLARLPSQENGQLGHNFDEGAKWINNCNSEATAKLVAQFERYIIDGKLSFGLFLKLVSTKQYASALTMTAIKHLETFFKNPEFPNRLPLPPVEKVQDTSFED